MLAWPFIDLSNVIVMFMISGMVIGELSCEATTCLCQVDFLLPKWPDLHPNKPIDLVEDGVKGGEGWSRLGYLVFRANEDSGTIPTWIWHYKVAVEGAMIPSAPRF